MVPNHTKHHIISRAIVDYLHVYLTEPFILKFSLPSLQMYSSAQKSFTFQRGNVEIIWSDNHNIVNQLLELLNGDFII